jgi:hypothetical protein
MPVPIPVMKRATRSCGREKEVVWRVAPTYERMILEWECFFQCGYQDERETHDDPHHGEPHRFPWPESIARYKGDDGTGETA